MKVTTFKDPKLEKISEQYQWVEVDADEQPEIAARYQVQGLPTTLILDADGNVTHEQPGYMPADKFLAFLASAPQSEATPPEPTEDILQRIRDAKGVELEKIVAEMVNNLADPRRADRQRILAELAKRPKECPPLLLTHLTHRRLAIRAAAAGALQFVTGKNQPFNAFGPKEVQSNQLKSWTTEIQKSDP